MAVHVSTEPHVFSLKDAPVLSAGRFDTVVASSDDLIARVKVYAEGGENAKHTHLHEITCSWSWRGRRRSDWAMKNAKSSSIGTKG